MTQRAIHSRLGILAPLKEWGGLEREIVILCKEFLELGVQPQLILTRKGQIPYPQELPKEIEIVDLRSKHKFDSIFKLIRHLKNNEFDALLTFKDHAAKVAIVAKKLGRKNNIPVFIKVTNTLSLTLRRTLKKYFAKWLYPKANKIIAISEGVKKDIVSTLAISSQKINVIYTPIITKDLIKKSQQEIEHPWLTDKQVPVVLGVGRLTISKDFITLVKAFAILQRQMPSRLIILGEGPQRKNIESKINELNIQNIVDLPGYVLDPTPWMARSDVFVLSSKYEGLGNVLVEALGVGTPVVSTDCPSGPSEILQNGEVGPLVPVGDYEQMSNSIYNILNEPPDLSTLRDGLERFQSNVIAKQNLQLMGLYGAY